MNHPYQLTLLRRTFAAIAASASLLASQGANAQAAGTVTLSGAAAGASSCSYSAMSVNPAGGVSVQCTSSGPVTPTPGAFSFTAATASGTANTNAQLAIQRTGGTLGAFDLYYWTEGAGCARAEVSGPVKYSDGEGGNKTLSVALGASGACTVNLAVPPPGVLATNSKIVVTVGGVVVTDPGPVTGCPTAPTNLLSASFTAIGQPLLQMQSSGQIVAIKLPGTGSRASSQVSFGESAGGAYTPQPVTVEISINKCPGVIDTDYNNFCNVRSTNGNFNAITWLSKAYSTINASNVALYGYCWAGEAGTQYYVNSRWTYSSCAFGAQVCGFAIQYNDGPY
jgi:hypothetical protein